MNGDGYFYLDGYIMKHEDRDTVMLNDVIQTMSRRYTCLRPPGATGTSLVTTDGLVVYGDVRPPQGSPTCKELYTCEIENGHCVRTIHGEVRAVLNAAKLGLCTEGATVYTVLKPCYQCTKVLIAAGITKIVYAGVSYDEQRTNDILANAPHEIKLVRLDMKLDYGQGGLK